MREKIWLRLRGSRLLRKLSSFAILEKPLRAASHLLLPSSRLVSLRVRGGLGKNLLLELNPRWHTPHWEGTNEMEVQQLFAQCVGAETTLYDVGGALGVYSMIGARLGADVIVFEPDTVHGACITRNVQRNGLECRIRLIQSAVFSHTGVVALRTDVRDPGTRNASVQPLDENTTNLSRVSCIKLDDFVKENPTPTFLKVDVEGAESEVLKGAEMLFRTIRPLLVCEIHDEANAAFVTGWLNEKGYLSRWLESRVGFPRHLYASPAD